MKMLKQLFLGSVTSACFAGCASQPPPPADLPKVVEAPKEISPAERLGEANALANKGDYAAALAAYDKVLTQTPDDAAAKFNRAVVLQRLGRLEEAKAAYESVLSSSPEDVQAALNLGAVLKGLGKYPEAIAVIEKALKSDEFNPSLLNNLSVLYRLEKKYDRAVEALRKLLKRDKENIDAYKNLSLVYFDQKKLKLSQTILENARKMAEKQGKQDADIYVNLGMILLESGENGKAMAAFKKAVVIAPQHVEANYNIGALALGHRDYGLAAKSYEVVAKATPNDASVAASLGYALQGLQQFEESAKWLAEAQALQLRAGAQYAQADAEQVPLQLLSVHMSAGAVDKAKVVAQDYMQKKGISCKSTDYDGFCGKWNGILLEEKMKAEAAAQPQPSEAKKEAKSDSSIFSDQAPAPEENAAPAEGAVPAEGTAAPAESNSGPQDAAPAGGTP